MNSHKIHKSFLPRKFSAIRYYVLHKIKQHLLFLCRVKIATLPDFLQHAKMEKEGLVHDISVYLGRQRGGGVPDRKNELEAFSCSFCPKCWSFECSLSKKLTAPSWRECTKCLDIASSSLLFSPVSATSHLLYLYYGYISHADHEADMHAQCSNDELLNAHSHFFSCLSSDCPCRAIHFIYSVHHINFPIPELCTTN